MSALDDEVHARVVTDPGADPALAARRYALAIDPLLGPADLDRVVSRVMAWGGRILPIGFTSGEAPSLAMNLPLLKNYSVVGCYWGAWAERQPQQSRAADEQLFAAVAQGIFRPQVSEVLAMASFADGLHRLSRRQVTGRIVLRV